jgi:curved DNA-binding protein CbpA
MNVSEAKRILGIESIEEARRAFLEKVRQLHPDKGGDTEKFKEFHGAYQFIREHQQSENGDDHTEEEDEGGEEWGEWVSWMSRWAKRVIHATNDPQTLRIKIPWKILTNRREILKIDYDGVPVIVPLHRTETFTVGGLHIQLIPNASIRYSTVSGEEHIESVDSPWFKEQIWLFQVPSKSVEFRIDGGEWSSEPGHYGNGVYWERINE